MHRLRYQHNNTLLFYITRNRTLHHNMRGSIISSTPYHKYVARPATCTLRTKLLLSLDIDIIRMAYLHHFHDICQASYLLASHSIQGLQPIIFQTNYAILYKMNKLHCLQQHHFLDVTTDMALDNKRSAAIALRPSRKRDIACCLCLLSSLARLALAHPPADLKLPQAASLNCPSTVCHSRWMHRSTVTGD